MRCRICERIFKFSNANRKNKDQLCGDCLQIFNLTLDNFGKSVLMLMLN